MDELRRVKRQVEYLTRKNLNMQAKNDELQVEMDAYKEELELETSEKKRIRSRFLAVNAELIALKGELEPLDDLNESGLTDSDEEDESPVVMAVNLTRVVHVPAVIDLCSDGE